MTEKIYPSTYKDINAVTLESDRLNVQFLPEFGGKMASFVDKSGSGELLVQAENFPYKRLEYDGSYVESECSGFDDMFPTIDVCYYENYPWAGVRMPDHGEICGLSWDYSIENGCLNMSVYGVRLPYRFEKRVFFKADNTLGVDYKVTNLSSFDMDFIWAAHLMLSMDIGGEIILPYGENEDITCVFSWDEGFGSYGDSMKWPDAKRRDGALQNLKVTAPWKDGGNNYKFYFNRPMPEGWCAYRMKSSDSVLVLSFPAEKVPYLGIWVNEGSFHGFKNIAVEPCTGAYDRIDLAKIHGQNSVLKAKSEYSWYFDLQIEQSGKIRKKER